MNSRTAIRALSAAILLVPVIAASTSAILLRVPDPIPTIQLAIDGATSADTILVAPGTYIENLVMTSLQSGVVLLSEEGPDSTTIDGDLANPVIRCSDVGSDTRIEGFTIVNGRATSIIFGNSLGGGIYLNNADVTVTGNLIKDNVAFTAGGGLYSREGSPTVIDNIFENNSASSGLGGGLYCGDGEFPVIEDNEFIDNSASSGGGGIACSRCPAVIERNIFTNNQAISLGSGGGLFVSASTGVEILENHFEGNGGSGGGGIYITRSNPLIQGNEMFSNTAGFGGGAAIYCNESSSPEIRENLIVSNTSSAAAGGIAVADTSNPMIIGNTLVANSATLGGGGLYITLQSNPTIDNNIIVGSPSGNGIEITGSASISSLACNDVWDNLPANYAGMADPTGSDGNISLDPEFCDPGTANYRLQTSSPCTAANAAAGCGRIGAEAEGCTVVDIAPGLALSGIQLYQNIPNPVRDRTRIRFTLSQGAHVRLAIYNVAGRLVRLAYGGRQFPAGNHEWHWDGRDEDGVRATPGVYFYALQANHIATSRKLILLD